jgi:hypothetical protein
MLCCACGKCMTLTQQTTNEPNIGVHKQGVLE